MVPESRNAIEMLADAMAEGPDGLETGFEQKLTKETKRGGFGSEKSAFSWAFLEAT